MSFGERDVTGCAGNDGLCLYASDRAMVALRWDDKEEEGLGGQKSSSSEWPIKFI
jgi:hypothetical protein